MSIITVLSVENYEKPVSTGNSYESKYDLSATANEPGNKLAYLRFLNSKRSPPSYLSF